MVFVLVVVTVRCTDGLHIFAYESCKRVADKSPENGCIIVDCAEQDINSLICGATLLTWRSLLTLVPLTE